MAGVISENYLSRPFSLPVIGQGGRELVFDIVGTNDEEEVRTLIEGQAPAAYLGRVINEIQAEPVGPGVWKGYARYVRYQSADEYTFDTAGGTVKMTQALSTIASYAPPGMTAPDCQGAIGVTEDGVEGVEVTVPQFTWSETHLFDDTYILAGYKLVVFNLTGTQNDAPFKGLAAGEVLFLGASGQKRGDDNTWAITFRFSASPNASSLTVGAITGISKYGQDYLDIKYAEYEDSGAKSLVRRPVAAYVQRVYPPADFSQLDIGV